MLPFLTKSWREGCPDWIWKYFGIGTGRLWGSNGWPCRDRALGRSPDWQDFVQVVGHAGVSGIAGLALGLDMLTVCYICVQFGGEDIWIVEVEDCEGLWSKECGSLAKHTVMSSHARPILMICCKLLCLACSR
jgi:hypothetical protein